MTNAKTTNGDARSRIMASTVKGESFEVSQWDGVTIELFPMSIATKSRIIGTGDTTGEPLDKLLPSIIIATCHEPESGEPLFSKDDIPWLSEQPAGVIEAVALAGLRVSGLDDEALERAGKDS